MIPQLLLALNRHRPCLGRCRAWSLRVAHPETLITNAPSCERDLGREEGVISSFLKGGRFDCLRPSVFLVV